MRWAFVFRDIWLFWRGGTRRPISGPVSLEDGGSVPRILLPLVRGWEPIDRDVDRGEVFEKNCAVAYFVKDYNDYHSLGDNRSATGTYAW